MGLLTSRHSALDTWADTETERARFETAVLTYYPHLVFDDRYAAQAKLEAFGMGYGVRWILASVYFSEDTKCWMSEITVQFNSMIPVQQFKLVIPVERVRAGYEAMFDPVEDDER